MGFVKTGTQGATANCTAPVSATLNYHYLYPVQDQQTNLKIK